MSHSQPTSVPESQPCPTLHSVPPTNKPIHLAVGMFDGVHLGHQAVIEAANHSARRTGGLSAVLSFNPHPSRLFAPQNPTRLLMPPQIKLNVLQRMGVGLTIIHPFDREFAAIKASDFPAYLKRCLPTLRSIYVGENFRYGKARSGDISALLADCRRENIDLFSAERIRYNGEPISSTRIRAALEQGQIEEANRLLGYSYFATGRISPGKQLGRKLGFPTLNLPWEPELPPAFGVYAVRICRDNGDNAAQSEQANHGAAAIGTAPKSTWYNAVANYGLRPTVHAETESVAPLLEVHVLESCPLTTADSVCVQWLHFLRPEQKFPSIEALQTQIRKDSAAAASLLG